MIEIQSGGVEYTLDTAFYVSGNGPGRGFSPARPGQLSEIYGLTFINIVVPSRGNARMERSRERAKARQIN